MAIQNIMYFVLGFLASGLLALVIVPSIWKRAVRLTKARIEAATPMTMSEFRADKDQLRAEFALSTRRLEKNVDALRTKLAGQLSEINRKKTDLAQLQTDRDQKLTIVDELENRESELRNKVIELEKTGVDLATKLRLRDREFDTLNSQLQDLRERDTTSEQAQQIQRLVKELEAERERSAFFQEQVTSLTTRLSGAEDKSSTAAQAISQMRFSLAEREDEASSATQGLTDAEARIASAELRLNELLEETHIQVEGEEARVSQLLADKFSLEEEMARLKGKIGHVENAVYNDWEQERLDQSHLRERLNDIASEVSKLVYAVDGETPVENDESLFDRVKKFAGDDLSVEGLHLGSAPTQDNNALPSGKLSDRFAALRNLQTT